MISKEEERKLMMQAIGTVLFCFVPQIIVCIIFAILMW